MRRREQIPGFKEMLDGTIRQRRYSDRAVNACTRALPTVRSVLGHQADSSGQSILFGFVDRDVWKLACFL